MKEDITQRIRDILTQKGISITFLSKEIGIIQTTLNRQLKGETQLSADTVKAFLNYFPDISPDWLITGTGGQIKKAEPVGIEQKDNNPYPIKPFIDSVYAVCGAPSGFSIAIKEAECEGLSLPFMKEYDFSIKAKGDSMINRSNPARSIRESDIVACRLWKSRSHVCWGEVYALATSEGVVIKKIQKSEIEGHIKCVSFNTEDGFSPYDLPVEEIFDWAIVTGVVSARNWN